MKRLLLVLLVLWLLPAAAIEVAEGLDAAQEARYRALAAELRCLVCQNQSLADSNADLAGDMRAVVRAMIKDGESDAAILAYMTARYGDFVLYRPPLKPATLILWGLPFVVLCAGAAAAVILMRRRATTLSDAERRQAEKVEAVVQGMHRLAGIEIGVGYRPADFAFQIELFQERAQREVR